MLVFLICRKQIKRVWPSDNIIGPVDSDYAEFLKLQAKKGSSTTPKTSSESIIGPVDPEYAEYLKLQRPKGLSPIPTTSHYVIGTADSDYAKYLVTEMGSRKTISINGGSNGGVPF